MTAATPYPYNIQSIPASIIPIPTKCASYICILSVVPGGVAAIIVPETICYLSKYANVRKWIMSISKIDAVISLHGHVFTPYTTARTAILLLSKIHQGESTQFPLIKINNDGYSLDSNRHPINENDLPLLLEYATDDRLQEYPDHLISRPRPDLFKFFEQNESVSISPDIKYWKLSELVEIRNDKMELHPEKEYRMPSLNSFNNAVVPKKGRLGKNIRGPKVIAHPSDIIIGLLHTQSNNGLFAIVDQEYVTTSQLVLKNKGVVSIAYLCAMLRIVLPTLSTSDLVGRENYSPETILSLPIPKPTPEIEKAIEPIIRAIESIESAKRDLIEHVPTLKEIILPSQ